MAPSKGWGDDQAAGTRIGPTRSNPVPNARPAAPPTPAAGEGGSGKHDLLPEMSGDQASGESTAVSRIPDARPTPAAGEGGSGRHDLLLEMSGAKGALADGFQEAVPTCIDTARRLPTPAGQESTGLRVDGLLKCECDYHDTQVDLSSGHDGFEDSVARCGYSNPTLVRRGYSTLTTPTRRRRGSRKATRRRRGSHKARGRGGRRHRDAYNYGRTGTAPVLARTTHLLVPEMDAERDGLKKSVARCGYHNPSLVRRDSTLPQRGLMPCPSMGSRKAVAAGEHGDGGGRGDRDAYNYDRTGTAPVLARTTDLLAANSLDKGTYRASMVAGGQGDGGGRGDRDSYNYDHTNTAPVLAPTTDLLATKGLRPNEWCILPNAIDPSGLTEFLDGSFSCGDKGGSLGSRKGASSNHYITQMNFYLSTGSVKDVNLVSDGKDPNNFSLRFEELKGRQGVIKHFCTSKLFGYDERESEISRFFCAQCGSCENIKKKSDETQVFVDLYGSLISLQKNLNNLNVAMLYEAACVRAGVKPVDCYPTYSRKILEPENLLSHYDIKKDSTVIFNPRLRGGTPLSINIEFETWEDKMENCPRYRTVALHRNLIGSKNRSKGVNSVTYLSDSLQYLCRKVLIGMCRKHYAGISFAGKFTSKQLLFDDDSNFRFATSIPTETYNRESALRDYKRISEIFDKVFIGPNRFYPMHAGDLIDFLRCSLPEIDPQSEVTIACVTNHYSLLSHSERIKMSEMLDTLSRMLGHDDSCDYYQAVGGISWTDRIKDIPAMNDVYLYHAKRNYYGEIIHIPYFEQDNTSLLHFSNNFFKHGGYHVDQLEAAFSLAMENENFMPKLLFSSMSEFRKTAQDRAFVAGQDSLPVTVQRFVNDVISMLGNNLVCCNKNVEPGTS